MAKVRTLPSRKGSQPQHLTSSHQNAMVSIKGATSKKVRGREVHYDPKNRAPTAVTRVRTAGEAASARPELEQRRLAQLRAARDANRDAARSGTAEDVIMDDIFSEMMNEGGAADEGEWVDEEDSGNGGRELLNSLWIDAK